MTLEELRVIITAETSGLKKAVSGVQSQLSSLSKGVSRVSSSIQNSFKKLSSSVTNSFKSLGKLVGLTAALTGLIKLGKAAVSAASSLEEIQNVVNVVFGSSASEIDAWAKSALKQFGLVESEAKDLASNFKAMANGMGIADSSGKAMSIRLTELAADLASFRNTTVSSAQTALSGVFTGETEALKKFGVVMTQANLEAYALTQGITKSYSAMTQAEKVALRYSYVLQTTADAQGDFARSSGSWANQIRVLKGQWTSFLGVLGQGITSTLAPLIKALNNVLEILITLTKTAFAAMGINFSVSSATVSSNLGSAADSAADMVDNINDATGAAKKLASTIAPFDELNLLNSKDSSSGSIGDTSGGGLDISDAEVSFEKTEEISLGNLDEMLNKINDWFENKMGPFLKDKAQWLAEKINDITQNVDWNKIGYTVANGLNQIIYAVDTFLTTLNGYDIGTAISDLLNGLTEKFDAAAFGKTLGDKIKVGLDMAIGFFENYDFSALGTKLGEVLSNIDVPEIAGKIGQVLSGAIEGGLDIAINVLANTDGGDLKKAWENFWSNIDFEEIKKKFSLLFQEIKKQIDECFGNGTVDDFITKIQTLIKVLGALAAVLGSIKIGVLLTDLGLLSSSIATGYKGLSGFFQLLGEQFSYIFGYFTGAGSLGELADDIAIKIGPTISSAILAIGNVVAHPIASIQSFGSTISTVFASAGTTISGFGTQIATALTSLPATLSSAVSSVGGFFASIGTSISGTVGNIAALISEKGVLGAALQGLKGIIAGLQGGVKSLFAALAANPIGVIIAAVVALVAAFIYLWNTCDTFKQFFVDIWENTLKPMFDQIAEKWNELVHEHIIPLWEEGLKPCIQAIWKVFKEVWDKIAHVLGTIIMIVTPIITGLAGAFGGFVHTMMDMMGNLIDIIKGILVFITGVFSGDWKKAWEGIVTVFQAVWNLIVDVAKAPINCVIGFINGMIGAIVSGLNAIIKKVNGLSFNVPDWVPGIGGQKFGFNLPTLTANVIPYLADGGVLKDPTLAMLAEYPGADRNPEIAAPQNILRETVADANGDMVGAFYQIAQQIIAAIDKLEMNVSIGDDTIASAAKRGSDDYKRRTGKPLFA